MKAKDKKQIIEIIKKHLAPVKIYLFGSRARGDYVAESDIDIALDGGAIIDLALLEKIKEEIEDTTIPFTVDIVDLHRVSEDFKKQILQDAVIWQ